MLKLSNKRKVSVNKICRACLTERGHLRDIFSTKIPKMLENIATVQVTEGDGLPSNICISCFHLVAKLYTFRKKLEKNDRFLKNHCKIIEKDILDLAVSDAQIKLEHDLEQSNSKDNCDLQTDHLSSSCVTTEEENTSKTDILHAKIDIYASDEDIPLSKRVPEDVCTARKSKERAKKIIDSVVGVDDEEEDVDGDLEIAELLQKPDDIGEQHITSNDVRNPASKRAHDYAEGPPPLIPIKLEIVEINPGDVGDQKLPDDAPPLVPIKPLVDAETILTIVKPSPDLKLTCPSCDDEFTSIEALKRHKLHSCQAPSMQCNICKKEFKERKKLIGHLKGHMVVKEYGCKICGKRYPNPSTFRVHMRTHTGERPFKCEVCGKGFTRWAGVVGHMKTHQAHKPFKCPTCGKGFKIACNLERHKILHSGVLPFCCSYCDKAFSQSDNLQLHIRTYHTKERPYLCNECGKGFVSSTRLNRHMWVHTGYKPYRCKSCPKAYSNSNDLKNHERTHIADTGECDKPYACQACDMRFYHPCRLRKHMKTHERQKTCTTCHKTFSCSRWLERHVSAKHHGQQQADSEDVQYVEEVVIENNQVYMEYA